MTLSIHMSVTSYKISVLKFNDCPIRYKNVNKVLHLLKCWRNFNATSEKCFKCTQNIPFKFNFKTCCGNFYLKPTNEYIVRAIAIYTPRHEFLSKYLKDQLKKAKKKYKQNFLVLPDPVYWQVQSTLVFEMVLNKITNKGRKKGKKRKRSEEDLYMYNKIQMAFLNHGSLSRRSEGKNTYFRKIALAKRSELTVRAMIVPVPNLKPNEIIIPESMEKELKLKGDWLILNRMPSLLPENFLALKVKDHWPNHCFGIPLEPSKGMNFDFDGDEFTGYVLRNLQSQAECESILNSEFNMYSFTMGLKLHPSYDMFVAYYLKYDEIDFLPFKSQNLTETLMTIYEVYGSKKCFDCLVKLQKFYLDLFQNEMFSISLEEIDSLAKMCKNLNYEQFEEMMKNRKSGCLAAQINAHPDRTFYQLYQSLCSVGLQCSKNKSISLKNNITSSFLKGLNVNELLLHAKVGIDGFISSSGISYQGYTYFKLINCLLNWIVNYRGEIVDGETVVEEDLLAALSYTVLSNCGFKEIIKQHLCLKD